MMKISMLAIVCLICFSFSAFSEKDISPLDTDQVVRLKSFKLKSTAFARYKKQKQRYASLKIDAKGVVTPAKGFKMLADKKRKEITVIAEDAKYQASVITGVEAISFGLFVVWCHCGGGLKDDCRFDMEIEEDYQFMTCEGGCGCGVAVTMGRTPPWENIVDRINLY